MAIIIEPKYMVHEEGTKFYEVITFWNDTLKRGVLVKRWSKVANARGGGECKIEPIADVRKLHETKQKTLNDKGKRGYGFNNFVFGLHDEAGAKSDDKAANLINYHYKNGENYQIFQALGIEQFAKAEGSQEQDEVVILEPTPEPERGDTWGSW